MLTPVLLALCQALVPPELPTRDLFGVCVDTADDVDRDGVPDLWVGDPSIFGPTDKARGRAWCISGRDGATLLRIVAPPGSRQYGWTIAGLGDIDGDGVRDVAVGSLNVDALPGTPAPPAGTGVFESAESALHVHSGRDGSLTWTVRGAADLVKEPWYSSAAGPALVLVGDWNGDGVDDLAIGWSYADGAGPDQGRVDVVSGKDGAKLQTWFGLERHDRFGFSLARVADVDGDGRAELAAGAVPDRDGHPSAPDDLRRTRSGYVRILSSKGGIVRTFHPLDGSRSFGFSLAAFPSEKDGAPGLIVGQAHDGTARNAITRWNLADGSMTQLAAKPQLDAWDGGWRRKNVTPPRTTVNESFATRVLAIADRDGDGRADVLVTEPQSFCNVPAGVLSSKSDAGRTIDDLAGVPIGRVELGNIGLEYSHVGIGLCAPGDVDGDGVGDFAISGASVRCGECQGSVVLVSGKTLRVIRSYGRAGRE